MFFYVVRSFYRQIIFKFTIFLTKFSFHWQISYLIILSFFEAHLLLFQIDLLFPAPIQFYIITIALYQLRNQVSQHCLKLQGLKYIIKYLLSFLVPFQTLLLYLLLMQPNKLYLLQYYLKLLFCICSNALLINHNCQFKIKLEGKQINNQLIMLPIKQQKKCQTHNTPYDLIGQDQQCELNCLICCDCLKTMNHQHKFEGINHKTISKLELATQFNKIKQFSAHQIKKCIQKLNQYMKKFTDWILMEVQKQKLRLFKIIDNIILTQITKQQEQLKILQQMFQSQYENLICKQIGKVSKKLFSFVPKQISKGFKRFHQYIQQKTNKMQQSGLELVKNPHYQSIVLRDAIGGIKYPDFNEPQQPPPPVSPTRTLTQPTSPANKRTSRRSIRKKPQQKIESPQRSLLDIKQFHVKIKKPLEFKDSDIIKTKDDITFVQKLFPMKVYDAKMLYKASQNNFSVKRFHQFCDNEDNTIVFVKTQFNKIIGGFTTIPWKSTNNTIHSDIRKASFLFSVTLKQKMQLMDQKSAIFNSMNFGPTFGNGADLAICHNANTQKTSYSEFPYSYGNTRYMENNQHSTFLFTGQQQGNHFLIKEWEVWKLDFNE